jgi:hypothetical protein
MKNIPDKIYLHVDIENEPTDDFNELDNELVYWGSTKADENDMVFYSKEQVRLIAKDAWKWAANVHIAYPNDNHTFDAYWEAMFNNEPEAQASVASKDDSSTIDDNQIKN